MSIFIFILIAVSGFLASIYFLKNGEFLERLGSTIFFSITIVPFININLALLNGNYINNRLTLLTSSFSILLFLLLLKFKKKKSDYGLKKGLLCHPSREELLTLCILISVLLFSFFYYSNSEFILSLGSYFIKGDAECFYLQSFKTIDVLNPGLDRKGLLNKTYEILCTPGNILFTSTFIPIFKMHSFKIIYLLSVCMLFIFIYLIVKRLVADKIIALIVAIFSVLNPYILSIEVLDRNIITLSVSAILIYLLLQYKNKVFLHGMIFGILAGTGVRFLPLIFGIAVLILYYCEGKRIMGYLIFIVGFIITFAFNIPHIYFHGFHSLGETRSSLDLIVDAVTNWQRTPFLPFPNLIFYLLNIISYFGYFVSGIILFGAFSLFKTNKKIFFVSSFIFLVTLFVLSYQRDWIEGDKHRIITEGFLSLYIFLAYGLKYIPVIKRHYFKRSVVLFTFLLLPFIFICMISASDFDQDVDFYKRRHLYQKEGNGYHRLVKDSLLAVGMFPNYKRLFSKLDIKRKGLEERLTFQNLFSKRGLPETQKFKDFYLAWKEYFFKKEEYERYLPGDYVYLKIDFEKLVTDLDNSVEAIKYSDMAAIDLEAKDGLFDIYYADLNVSWQRGNLPACVILDNDAINHLKELTIELNAFVSFGKNEMGLDVINSVDFKSRPHLARIGYKTGMMSFPLYEENGEIIVKVPSDIKIIIKNWFINGENGIPYKVDSWCIAKYGHDAYRAEFFYNEQESYL